jgi:replicative DNA helicase
MSNIERQAISACMKDARDVYAAASAGLRAEMFSEPNLIPVWEALVKSTTSSPQAKGVEAVWLSLSSDPQGWTLGALCDLDNEVPTSLLRAELVGQVIDAYRVRRLKSEVGAAHSMLSLPSSKPFEELWEGVSARFEAARKLLSESQEEGLADYAERAALAVERPETALTVPTGWPSWDQIATPLKAGEMVTIAARPGMGKTALALQIANRLAYKGKTVLFFSLEMMGEELAHRMALQRSGRLSLFSPETHAKSLRALKKDTNFIVFDARQAYGMTAMESRAKLHAAAGGVSLVVIDYLQLIVPSDRRVPREQQVSEMSRRCKQLAGAISAPVIVLAQLNREVEKHDRRPILSDLRESGAIEQDSDRVWFIHQDQSQVQHAEAGEQEVLLIQAKCRGGPPNVAKKFVFDRPIFSFKVIQPQPVSL